MSGLVFMLSTDYIGNLDDHDFFENEVLIGEVDCH